MKRIIKTQVITNDHKLKLSTCGKLTDSNFNLLKMTAKQYLAFKVKQFKNDKALLNFNAEITVKQSNCKNYWACSIAVTTLVR